MSSNRYLINLNPNSYLINNINKMNNIIYDDNKSKNNYTYINHKEHYINYNNNIKNNISKSNTKSFFSRRNERSNNNFERNHERNSERNNDKILFKNKNQNSYHDTFTDKKNHNFYESKENKNKYLNNYKYINIENKNIYNDDNSKNNLNCICPVGKDYSAKRNLIRGEDHRHTFKKTYNFLKKDYYRNNTTPKNTRHITHIKNYKMISKSPIKMVEKINSLFSSRSEEHTSELQSR